MEKEDEGWIIWKMKGGEYSGREGIYLKEGRRTLILCINILLIIYKEAVKNNLQKGRIDDIRRVNRGFFTKIMNMF